MCLNSGWAFATAEQMESDTMRLYGQTPATTYTLSPQQFLDCVSSNDGCQGGTLLAALNYAAASNGGNGGITGASQYPYASFYGASRACSADISAVIRISGYFTQLANNEACMAHYVQTTGPIIVCVGISNSWYSYTGGIMPLASCPANGNNPTHCMQAVGVLPTTNGGYWILRNSVGTNWGEKGYIRVSYGSNTCGIANSPIYTATTINL